VQFSPNSALANKMNKNAAKIVQKHLDRLFATPAIPLSHANPYTLLIAVLLSARCTDKKVNEITPLLFNKASTPEQMIGLSTEEVREIIKPCGLSPTKAKAIKALSQILLDRYNGQVPRTLEELEQLPGVGHKTASVVLAQAFATPAFPVDTHIHRCSKRWGLSSGKNVVCTERDLKNLFPETSWIKLHLQIIYYARAYCSAKKHVIEQCPICSELQRINSTQ
jgi:endonuclease III